jgi:hypothetical protein
MPHPEVFFIINMVFQTVKGPISEPFNGEAMSGHHPTQVVDWLNILNQIVNCTVGEPQVQQDILQGGPGGDKTLHSLHLRLIDFEVADDHIFAVHDICPIPTGGERVKEKEAKTDHRNAHEKNKSVPNQKHSYLLI